MVKRGYLMVRRIQAGFGRRVNLFRKHKKKGRMMRPFSAL